jgi:ribose transport system permease protein
MRRIAASLPALLLVLALVAFGVSAPGFADWRTLLNIIVQSSSLAIVAAGMTVVLLTGGIDLSVGSVMFLSAAVAGRLALSGSPLAACLGAACAIGLAAGAVNAALVVRFRLPAFIATLGLLYVVRGYTLYFTQTRAMNLPESVLRLASTSLLGIPTPVWLLALVIFTVEAALRATAWGRRIYAVGYSPEQGRRAGLAVGALLTSGYLLCGVLAALGGLLSVAQLGAVSPTFGNGREFAAIAAAVLGGTSLFGGRGNVFPGTLVGALLIQTVETGLVMLNANPYLYPIVMASVIFGAVLLDSLRTEWVRRAMRRTIRPLAHAAGR